MYTPTSAKIGAPMASKPIQIGRFLVEEEAGSGAMGVVYRARDSSDGQPVALKLLHGVSEVDLARFAREGRVLATLAHPGIVRYVDHGTTPRGETYLAMEWLDGEDLRARLVRVGLTVGETVTLGQRLAGALAELHAHGLVHRDIKPGNVFLAGRRVDEAKVIDFGLARRGDASVNVTRTGVIVGTPAYMSPEQARGQRDVDGRADIFSLGCVLYKCLTGRPPFEGASIPALLTKVLLDDAPRIRARCPEVPAGLEAIVLRMLAKKPDDRFRTAGAVRDALEAVDLTAGAEPFAADASPRPPAASESGAPPGLTGSEQRVVAMVLIGATDEPVDASALVAEHRGHLDELFDGTRVVTLEGSQVATDRAAMAARCALALRAALPRVPLALAMGQREVGAQRQVGEAIERAAALLERNTQLIAPASGVASSVASSVDGAPTTAIAIDEVTAALLDSRFVVVRGPAGADLVRVRDTGMRARTLTDKPSALVGRAWELATLQTLFADVVEEQLARPVILTGPPGIGKSRLAREVLATIRAAHPEVEVWVGRGDSLRAGAPLGLLGQVLQRASGIQRGEPLAERRRRVEQRVARHVGADDVAQVSHFIGEMVGAPFPGEVSRELRAARADAHLMGEQMARAWETFLAAETAAHPLLLLFEDLQWGDRPTVQFVGDALQRLERRPWMVLAMARPEVHTLFPKLWATRSAQEIRLNPLARKAAAQLVASSLGDAADEETVARITAQAEGNAFYLEELIRAARHPHAGPALPEPVLAMVQTRLEALDPETRRMLRAASVFGEVFWPGGVAALLAGPSLDPTWATLIATRDLVVRRAGSRFAGDEELAFRNAILREAAYAMLTPGDRALGHLLAGDWLEHHGEDDAMVLAHHFDRGGDQARAGGHYLRAAEQAMRAHDPGTAIAAAEEALARARGPEARTPCLDVLAEIHAFRVDFLAAEPHAAELARLAPRGSAPWVRAMSVRQSIAATRGRQDELHEVVAALTGVEPAPDATAPLARALASSTFLLALAAEFDAAAAVVLEIDALVAPVAADAPVSRGFMHLAHAYLELWGTGSAWDARSRAQAALSCFGEARGAGDALLARVFLALAELSLGAPEEAQRQLEEITGTEESLVTVLREAYLPWALIERGAFDEAQGMLEPELSRARRGAPALQPGRAARAQWALGEIARRRGDLVLAEREIALALEGLGASVPDLGHALAALAATRLALGRPAGALTCAREAVDLLRKHRGYGQRAGMIRLVYAEALDAGGDATAARVALTVARHRLRGIAARIPHEETRARFLERVPEHARTLALARLWQLGDGD